MCKMGKLRLLRLIEVLQKRSRRNHPDRELLYTESDQGIYLEMPEKDTLTAVIVKDMRLKRIDRDTITPSQIVHVKAADKECLVADHLGRFVFHQFIVQLPEILHLRQIIVTGRDIRHGNSDPCRRVGNAHQEIIFGLLERLHVQICAGCDDPDDIALHKPLRQLRVLHLFTDSHLVASADQFGQIPLDCMIRDSAHRCALLESACLSRQGDLKLFGCRQRIVKKHFIKISQPVKEDTVLILFLCLHVLLHHGS